MAISSVQRFGAFSRGRKTAAFGTAWAQMIPPYGGIGFVGTPGGQAMKARPLEGIPHITTLIVDAGSTIHSLAIMRPLNYTWFSADAVAGQAVVTLYDDPGIYSTNYKFALANGKTVPSTANSAIASGDYVVYQAADGHWVMDTAAGSWSSTTSQLTLTANLPTGGVLTGAQLYTFGIYTDTDPATNEANQLFDTTASARLVYYDANGLFCALHPGDPLIVFNANATAASTLQLASGYYERK